MFAGRCILLCLWTGPLAQGQRPMPARTAQLALQIGEDMGVDDAYNFGHVIGVAASRSGQIYVLDILERNVKVFDASGKFLRTFGRPGQGPGEFELPGDLRLSDSTVNVTDVTLRRVSSFTLDGKHLRTQRLPTLAGSLPGQKVFELRGGSTLAVSAAIVSPSSNGASSPSVTVSVQPPSASRADTLLTYRTDDVRWETSTTPGPSGGMSTGFGDGGAWALLGDSLVAVADGYTGAVRWYIVDESGARLRRTASLGRQGKPVTSGDLAGLERVFRTKYKGSRIANLPVKFGAAPPLRSIATRAVFADDGSLWIADGSSAGRTTPWSVFAAGASMPYVVQLPSSFTLTSVRGDRLYGYTKSEFDSPIAQVYRLGAP
ncbi:MAG: 6-bladed beta-propeller [Gemmatimonadaceae bacterium]